MQVIRPQNPRQHSEMFREGRVALCRYTSTYTLIH